jgi:hypothetical protein
MLFYSLKFEVNIYIFISLHTYGHADFHTNVNANDISNLTSFVAVRIVGRLSLSCFSIQHGSTVDRPVVAAPDIHNQSNLVMLARGKGQPDRVILDILATLNQEKAKHDIVGLYNGRLRSHAENFEVWRNSPKCSFIIDFVFHVRLN